MRYDLVYRMNPDGSRGTYDIIRKDYSDDFWYVFQEGIRDPEDAKLMVRALNAESQRTSDF